MKITVVKILSVVVAYAISILLATPFGMLYDLFPATSLSGGFIGAPGTWEWIVGFPLAVIFTLTFLLHAHGARFKWHWNVLALAPVIIFEIGIDPLHIYIPSMLALIAWGLGTLAHKTLTKLAPQFMRRMQ